MFVTIQVGGSERKLFNHRAHRGRETRRKTRISLAFIMLHDFSVRSVFSVVQKLVLRAPHLNSYAIRLMQNGPWPAQVHPECPARLPRGQRP